MVSGVFCCFFFVFVFLPWVGGGEKQGRLASVFNGRLRSEIPRQALTSKEARLTVNLLVNFTKVILMTLHKKLPPLQVSAFNNFYSMPLSFYKIFQLLILE